jgi:two-component system, OmpR family, response regulator ResD
MKNRILVAEDEPNLRALIVSYLKREGYEVTEASNGEEALEHFVKGQFSLVLLDVMMPVMNGLDACREIRRDSQVPVVMLTSRSAEYDELSGFACGADEYITKPFSPAILVTRIKSVLKRTGIHQEEKLVFEDIVLNQRQRKVTVGETPVNLTPREFDLLRYLMSNIGVVVSREQILDKVWGFDYEGEERTVDTHIKCLRNKMLSSKDSIKTIRKVGYVMNSDHDTKG